MNYLMTTSKMQNVSAVADDIRHISIGPNIIHVKTPFADGTNRIYVSSKEIEQLENILLGEVNDKR